MVIILKFTTASFKIQFWDWPIELSDSMIGSQLVENT